MFKITTLSIFNLAMLVFTSIGWAADYSSTIGASSMRATINGANVCNGTNYTQVPSDHNYFIGRIRLNDAGKSVCNGTKWRLALFRLDSSRTHLRFVRYIFPPSARIATGEIINHAFDATATSYNGEIWVSFVCVGDGPTGRTRGPGGCVGPFNLSQGIDPARTTLAVRSRHINKYKILTASTAKVFSYRGKAYLYWTMIDINPQTREFRKLTTRGMRLRLKNGKLYSFKGAADTVDADSPNFSVEVLGVEPSKPWSNTTADGYDIKIIGDKVVLSAAIGGSAANGKYPCGIPTEPSYGCYRTAFFYTEDPLGYRTFNQRPLNPVAPSALPFNPSKYVRFFTDPVDGKLNILGGFGPLNLPPGFNAPANVMPRGFFKYPIQFPNISRSLSDGSAPKLISSTPTGGFTVKKRTLFNFTVSDDVAVDNVQFKIDGRVASQKIDTPPFNYPLDSYDLFPGKHRLDIVMEDTSGRRSVNGISFVVRHNYFLPNQMIYPGDTIYSSNNAYRLVLQGRGNLVIYQGSNAIWHTRTHDSGAIKLVLQGSDGNLVLRDKNNRPIWWSIRDGGSSGKPEKLELGNDGRLRIYDVNSKVLWIN